MTTAVLESDSKSRIYVVRIGDDGIEPLTMVLKWYEGARQPQAMIEESMNTYFRQCLAPHHTIVPIVAVVPVSSVAQSSLSLAIRKLALLIVRDSRAPIVDDTRRAGRWRARPARLLV